MSMHFGKYIIQVLIAAILVLSSFSAAISQETLNVRSGDHPSYSRVVFDWNRNVVYDASLVNDKLEVVFSANAVPDFTAVMRDDPQYLSNPIYTDEGGNLKVTFDAYQNGQIRHFRSGTRVVVDLMVGDDVPPVIQRSTSIVTNAEDNQPVESNIEIPAVASSPSVEVTPVRAATSGSVELSIVAQSTNNAITIDYNWDKDVKAAAFIRAGTLWVIFDQYTVADHNGLQNIFDNRLRSAAQLEDLTPTILTYSVEPNQNVRMTKVASGWQLSLRSGPSVPQLPITIGHQSSSSVGENIFLMADELGDVITVEDPFVGDNLAIVTAEQSSHGIMENGNYTEFNILKSAQGIAVQLIADDIFVTKYENGVAVSGQNGLAVSRSQLPVLRAEALANPGGAEATGEQMLLDFNNWQNGPLPGQGYVKNRHELLYQLSTTTDSDRNEARWKLATFNLANNNSAEAIGILELMAGSEPAFIENPAFRAVLGVANVKLRRFDEAIELLNHKSLVAELDTRLWRSLAHEAKGEHQKALDDFNIGFDVLALQTDQDRVDFLFSSLRTGNALENVEFMNSQIGNVSNLTLNARQLTELDYWRAVMAEKSADDITAADLYDSVIATRVRYPAARAKFARVNQQMRMGEIEGGQAIDELEKLRFAWRGDDFELDLLKRLGQLYVDQHEYREGLSILRQASTYFPRSPKVSGLTRTMSEIYYDLFMNGGADNMPPLRAMALFLEFRELTPLGSDGDTMSRNLASRMVTVDLLTDAAELLEHQVENRLQGVARADIASDLAKIYVMNKESDKALEILRATRNSQVPEDIELERRLIEIRALVELGQYEEAEVMLDGMTGDVADGLRADVYWNMEDWRRVVSLGEQNLGPRWQESDELDEGERQTVLRMAVALSLDEDEIGLERLRDQYIGHMENGLFANAFEIITAKEQKSGADIRQLTQTIASVDRLETFMDSYRDEFALRASNVN